MPGARRVWWWAALAVIAGSLLIARFHFWRTVVPPGGITDRSVTEPLNQPGGGAAPPLAYEIYSALYQAPAGEPLAFANDSATDIPQLDGGCLKPSTPQQREMAAAFESANRLSHRWEQKFTIPQSYRLLTPPETAEALDCLGAHGQAGSQCAKYTQLRHLRLLGVPGFDPTRTRALVSVLKKCGRYCGSGGIFEVQKSGNTWRRADPSNFTSNCSWMY